MLKLVSKMFVDIQVDEWSEWTKIEEISYKGPNYNTGQDIS